MRNVAKDHFRRRQKFAGKMPVRDDDTANEWLRLRILWFGVNYFHDSLPRRRAFLNIAMHGVSVEACPAEPGRQFVRNHH